MCRCFFSLPADDGGSGKSLFQRGSLSLGISRRLYNLISVAVCTLSFSQMCWVFVFFLIRQPKKKKKEYCFIHIY